MSELNEELALIPPAEIFADEDFNCRGVISHLSVIELAKDIATNGLTQPITIQPWDKGPEGTKYRLIAGYRRYKAHQLNAAETIKSIIKHGISDDEAVMMNLSENIQREDLTIAQEAAAIQKLKLHGWTMNEVGAKIGKSYGWVQVRYMFLELPPDIQKEIVDREFPNSIIRDLWLQQTSEDRYELFRKIKDARLMGKKRPVNPLTIRKDKPNAKRARGREEMELMQDTVREVMGNNLATVALAWAMGEVDDLTLHKKLREEGLKINKYHVIPQGLMKSQQAFSKQTLAASRA